jgi:hypothetical protein
VSDLDIDVVLCPFLGLKLSPLHVSVDAIGIVTEPALELVIGRRHVVILVKVVLSEGY